MKKYLEGSDLFINYHAVANIPNPKGGEMCEHVYRIDGFMFYHPVPGEYATSYMQIYLTEKQIIEAYENMQSIKNEKVVIEYEHEYPF
jgi:hypothetical protein